MIQEPVYIMQETNTHSAYGFSNMPPALSITK